jgi:hypothetical protein
MAFPAAPTNLDTNIDALGYAWMYDSTPGMWRKVPKYLVLSAIPLAAMPTTLYSKILLDDITSAPTLIWYAWTGSVYAVMATNP